MLEFIAIALSFPVVIFAPFMVAITVYWLLAIMGITDVDSLDGGAGDGALEGTMKGAGEAFADGALDGSLKGGAEALAGAHEGSADGAADGLDAGEHGVGLLSSLLGFLGVGRIPVTIVLSVLTVIGWLTCFVFTYLLLKQGLAALAFFAVGTGLFLGSCLVAIALTSAVLRPFANAFKSETMRAQESLIGHTCVITSQRADARFGRAEYSAKNTQLVLDVRCMSEAGLQRGETGVIVGYDREKNFYVLEPLDLGIPTQKSANASTSQSNAKGSNSTLRVST